MNFVTNIIVVLRTSSLNQCVGHLQYQPQEAARYKIVKLIKLMEEIFKSVTQEMVLITQKPLRILKIKYPLVQMLNYLTCDPDTVMYYGI